MPAVTIGNRVYRISTWQRAGVWTACAVRLDNGDRHGPAARGATQELVIATVTAWLEWQAAHAAALDELQNAERAYHRAVAEHALAGPAAVGATRARRAALEKVEAARSHLDAIRDRRPASLTGG